MNVFRKTSEVSAQVSRKLKILFNESELRSKCRQGIFLSKQQVETCHTWPHRVSLRSSKNIFLCRKICSILAFDWRKSIDGTCDISLKLVNKLIKGVFIIAIATVVYKNCLNFLITRPVVQLKNRLTSRYSSWSRRGALEIFAGNADKSKLLIASSICQWALASCAHWLMAVASIQSHTTQRSSEAIN